MDATLLLPYFAGTKIISMAFAVGSSQFENVPPSQQIFVKNVCDLFFVSESGEVSDRCRVTNSCLGRRRMRILSNFSRRRARSNTQRSCTRAPVPRVWVSCSLLLSRRRRLPLVSFVRDHPSLSSSADSRRWGASYFQQSSKTTDMVAALCILPSTPTGAISPTEKQRPTATRRIMPMLPWKPE
jgi:hypothetical protein